MNDHADGTGDGTGGDILDIELEDVVQCYNPSCRAAIAPPDEMHRYCPRCGMAQVFECTACPSRPGALIRVADECECPRCGALYVLCEHCYHPVAITPDRPLECPDGCPPSFRAVSTGTHGPYGGIHRAGCVPCEFQTATLEPPAIWRLGEPVGDPVCNFGRVFFATARGTIRAIREETGRDVEMWDQAPLFPGDPATIHLMTLQVSERYVYFAHGSRIVACSVVDGDPCFSLDVAAGDLCCGIANDRLLVCGRDDTGALLVEMHDTKALCRDQDSLLSQQALPAASGKSPQPVAYPAATPDSFLVRDLDGNIVEVFFAAGKDSRVLWENVGYEYVSVPAVRGRYAYLLTYSSERGTAVFRVGLEDGRTTSGRVPGVRPAYIGARVGDRHLYFYDGDRDFYQLDLAALASPPATIFHGVDATGDMLMDTVVGLESTQGQGLWLLSLMGTQGDLTPRMVHSTTQSRPTLNAPGDGHLALAASNKRIFLSDTATGEVSVYAIPGK